MFEELFPKIPLHEAASFFYRIKNAGWGTPPDLSGELEGQFTAPVEQVLQQLTKIITAKFTLVMAYYTYGESLRDLSQRGIRMIIFYEHAQDELKAAEFYLKRAAVLGGAIHLTPPEPPPASTDPAHIVQVLIRAEQEAIMEQRLLRQMCGEENPMKVGIEESLLKDQHHLDELWQLLPSELHEQAQGEMAAGAEPPVAEPPAEESAAAEKGPAPKEAAARLRLGLQMKLAGPRTAAAGAEFSKLLSHPVGRGPAGAAHAANEVGKILNSPALYGAAGLVGGATGAVRGHMHAKEFRQAARKDSDSKLKQFAASHPGLYGAGTGALGGVGGWALGNALSSRMADKVLSKLGAEKTAPTDSDLKETGRQRAVTQLSAEAHREKGRHGERIGETLGRAGGALAGAAAGRKLIGGRLGTMAGLAAGMGMGGKAGKELGAEHDIRKNAMAMRLKLAAVKLGFGPPLDEYLAMHQAGEQAQQQNEAEFYRNKLQEMQATGQGTQQQIADLTAQLQQAQEQQAQVGSTIQAANEEAMSARDDAMQHAQMAANMRLGYQKIREQILQLASQDPETLNSLPTAMPPGAGAGMAPGMAEGMGVGQPGAAPQAVMPGEVPAEEGGPGMPGATKPSDGQGGSSAANPTAAPGSVKIGGLRDHAGAIAGGALGAVAGAKNALGKAKELPDRAAALEGATQAHDGSFASALDIAKAHAGVAESENAAAHPISTALKGGLKGGAMGAAGGAMAQRLAGNLGQLFQ